MSEQALLIDPGEIERQIERHRDTGWVDLDPKARAFAVKFVNGFPMPTMAAKEAGISSAQGKKYFNDPVVRAFISDLQEMDEGTTMINRRNTEHLLFALAPVFFGHESAPTVVPGVGIVDQERFYPQESLRVLDMMNRMSGGYNSDLSQNSILQIMEAFQQFGRDAQKKTEPVDPRLFRQAIEHEA